MSFQSYVAIGMTWAIIGLVAGTIAHEAGHCVAAALASLPVLRVRIGTGTEVMQTRLGSIALELRLVPVGGFVWIKADRHTPRPRLVVFMLGGIAANAAVLAVSIWRSYDTAPGSASEAALIGFGMAQLMLIAMTLIPVWGRVLGIRFASDGLQIVHLIRGRHSLDVHRTYEELLARYASGRVPRMTEASPVLREQLARAVWFDQDARRRTLETMQAELGRPVMSPEERLVSLDVLVSIALITRDPVFFGNLQDWSRQIAEIDPGGALTTGLRGVVLVELGDFAGGKALLDTVARSDFDPTDPFETSEHIVRQAFIARAEGALGDPPAGRRRLVDVRRAIGTNSAYESLRPLVDRIDRELIAGRYQPRAAAVVEGPRNG